MVTQHVHHTDLRHGHAKEVGTLVDDGTDEQTTIGTTIQSQILRRGVIVLNEVFSAGDTVVEDILLLQLGAGDMPFFTVFVAAS